MSKRRVDTFVPSPTKPSTLCTSPSTSSTPKQNSRETTDQNLLQPFSKQDLAPLHLTFADESSARSSCSVQSTLKADQNLEEYLNRAEPTSEGTDNSDVDPTFQYTDHIDNEAESLSSSQSYIEQPSSQPTITEDEILSLHAEFVKERINSLASNTSNAIEARTVAAEDVWSSLFSNEMDCTMDCSLDSNDGSGLENNSDGNEGNNRANLGEGLKEWKYCSPFEPIQLDVDGINEELGKKFVEEANAILRNVSKEIRDMSDDKRGISESDLSRLAIFDVFLPEYILAKIATNVNRVLRARRQESTFAFELKGIIILHILAASYSTCVATMTSRENKEFFYQIGISADRYNQVWSALCCTVERRQRVEECGGGWSNIPRRANALVTELEDEFAAINRIFLLIPQRTILSLDDDHQRLRSRAVAQRTVMSHVNNPKKALGPVNNAICSALNPVFLASHYSRTGEKSIDTWERLIRLLQGVPTTGPIRPMTDSTFGADRGYSHQCAINFLNDRLGATVIGTHKRSLDYPFIFGDGPLRKRHKGVEMSEKGCRAIYSARCKPQTVSGRPVEAVLYRESYSGRVAAVYHNNDAVFKASKFTLIPKTGFRLLKSREHLGKFHRVYERCTEPSGALNEDSTVLRYLSRSKVAQVLAGVDEITVLQSEDPGLVLARAFQYTSRTTCNFLRVIANNYEVNIRALAEQVHGKLTGYGTSRFSQSPEEATTRLQLRFQGLWELLKMIIASASSESPFQETKAFLLSATRSELNNKTKEDLLSAMNGIGCSVSSALRKGEIIDKIMKLQANVQTGAVVLQENNAQPLSAEKQMQVDMENLRQDFYRQSLASWVMKPLVSTAGMKEGTFNEAQVLKSLPQFFDCSPITVWNSKTVEEGERKLVVDYIRTVGLILSRFDAMVSNSPDGLMVCVDDEQSRTVCILEIKTMTALRTIESARNVQRRYDTASLIRDVGRSADSAKVFLDLVPSTEYRLQCLHHTMCLQTKTVCFVVAKGSNCGVGEVIYAALIEFVPSMLSQYSYMLAAIRTNAFEWIGKEARHIPEEYDSMLKSSHATDLHSYATYYCLSQAYRSLVKQQGTLPPAPMIRTTVLVYWNHLKGGVDEFNRALTSLCFTNSSENPIVSIIGRLLCAQVSNAAVLHRISRAKNSGALPESWNDKKGTKGYRELRHDVSRAASFASYARQLAKEFKFLWEKDCSKQTCQSQNMVHTVEEQSKMVGITPLFRRNVIEKYNRFDDMKRRLSRSLPHERVKGKPSYWSVCSYGHTIRRCSTPAVSDNVRKIRTK